MIDSIIIIAFIVASFVYAIYRLAKFFWMSWFDGTLMFYLTQPTKESSYEPFIFFHDGEKYKVFVTHEKIENNIPGTKLSRSNVFINDNLVLMISRMQIMFLVKRSIDVDLKYVNGDIFKILKWARKYWNNQFDKNHENEIETIKLINPYQAP